MVFYVYRCQANNSKNKKKKHKINYVAQEKWKLKQKIGLLLAATCS